MDERFRRRFNDAFSEELYARYRDDLERHTGCPIEFRLAETPVFLPPAFRRRVESAGSEILARLQEPARLERMRQAIPERWNAPGMTALPTFAILDFAVTVDERGEAVPKLVELQGFPSIIAFETLQRDAWCRVLAEIDGLDRDWRCWHSGLDRDRFLQLAARTIVGERDPGAVVLLDLHPEHQKTFPDFAATRALFGVVPVCPTTLRKRGRKLVRRDDAGDEVPVERIYYRIVVDELERRDVALPFDFRDELDVEWSPHPNWFWTWSKASLPHLDHPAVPRTRLLSEIGELPPNLAEDHVLKPLFSFAGGGVNVAPTPRDVAAIPPDERSRWCLQEKIAYADALSAVDGGGIKVEVRLMYLRPDDDPAFVLAENLCRLARGKMMGVDFNRDQTWVGASVGIWPADEPTQASAAATA